MVLLWSRSGYPQTTAEPNLFSSRYRIAEELLQKGDLVQAYIEFLTLYDYAPDNTLRSEVKKILGDILFKWNDTYAAENMYNEAYSLHKGNRTALKKLVIAKAENLSDDFYNYFKLIQKEEIDSELLFYYGRYVLRKEKKPRDACDIFDSVRRESEFFPKASFLCGIAMLMIGDRDEAMRRFKNAYDMAQDKELKEQAQIAIARIYSDLARFQDALPYYLGIGPDSKIFYEARYEVCWIFYSLERYDDTQRCIEYFKGAKRSHLSKRLDVLEAFLYMNTDLVRAFLLFTSIADYSEMFLSKIVETKEFDQRFWRKDAIKYFSSIEPDIKSWLDFFPEYKLYRERLEYIASLKKEIDNIIAQLEKLKSISVIVADKSIKRYFKNIYDIQSRIHQMLSSFTLSLASYDEKNFMLSLFSVFEELKNMDSKARELAAIASLNIHKVSSEREFKNWEKKYTVYDQSLKAVIAELDKVTSFHKKNSEYITKIISIITSKNNGSDQPIADFISLYNETNNLFLDFSNIWKDIIRVVIKYVDVQEKKLKRMSFVLESFIGYLREFEGLLLRYILLSRVKREVKKTYALAKYGFIEATWVMKERESDILDKLHIVRLEEENKLREMFVKFAEEVKSLNVQETSGVGESSFEVESSKAISYIDEIDKFTSKSIGIMAKVGGTKWKEPDKTIQELIEEKEREKEKRFLEKFGTIGR